jgi:hypothetical protein
MQKTSPLKECIRGLITEAGYGHQKAPVVNQPQPAFELIDPVKVAAQQGDYYIAREFPLKMSEELMKIFGLTPEEIAEYTTQSGGVVEGEYEMYLDIDVYYTPGQRSRNRWEQPDDPEEFLVEGYRVEGIFASAGKSIILSKEDGQRLAEYLGELSDDEVERIRESYMDTHGPSSGPDPGDYDFGDY